MKVALIGVGGMGYCHYLAYKDVEGAEVVAVCDVNMEMLKEKVGADGIRMYESFDELLKNEQVDFVDICTPTYLHAEQSIKAMEAGFHVLSEKPMALNNEETAKILATVERTGKRYMVAHVVRFGDAYMYLKDAIDSQKYGKLIRLSMKRISGIPMWGFENWFQDINRSGLEGLDMTIHDIDFMQYCLGEPKDIVSVNYDLKGLNNYVGATYIYDGCSVSIEGGWYKAKMPFEAGFMAIFENGYIKLANGKITDNGNEVDLNENAEAKDIGINVKLGNSYAREIQYFTDCLKNGKPTDMVTPRSSADSIALVKKTLEKAIQI